MEIKEATRFLIKAMPAAGFKLGRGESEPQEAEARFSGNDVVGFFKIRTIADCPGALQFAIRVQSIDSIRNPPHP